ncbi:ArsR family transcriptional regulator [Flavobacterium psychrophilum]|uniref:Schlafen AlbA-2 domain-containing protein n=1 Tax=Flavobacterium psychrophilum (strain ATCC 49511 / DSM 21280 / CIP 103535 / JIP02/86) TaxID=402612 RepID=A6GZU8_FLAPJ|nr:ATP-binding protein [Flavobacterium psychrophilum]AIG30317.1 ArsR family transcriptional regulator [Flavobacterium psychrophilum]AIG32592.1 ArsR family transcriptional regulator [Flavobacterium psychrophilum]AIG34747.1 ArsR family transcriptional regulator [Flavobacterium psychrophilum]AIG37112.1 ArsR family transcriptional regulator [Flavobacterium psychrophilum]AIG39376.1 ArsR family transcriptional regulator [Flavobacterium psychrophilum]
MLNPTEIKSIVSSGEGFNAEFKVNLPTNLKSITEEVCAFANAYGGVVLIGVDDKNIIKGVTIDNSKRSAIQNSIGEISPPLQCEFYIIDVEGKNVAVIEVPSGQNKPYVLSGAIYVRQGPNSQKLTTVEEMRNFFQQAEKIYFDEASCKEIDIKKDIPKENIDTFRFEAGLVNNTSDEQVFSNLKLISNEGYLKNGAVLFFAKEPERFFEKAVIRCVAFDGLDKRYIIDDKIMTGTLFQQYQQSMIWLKSKLNVRYDIESEGGKARKELWEIPEIVFKEAIINSLAHRDYYDKGGRITIELFNDRVEVTNPGGLVSSITKNEFGKKSSSRNPLIFGLFERMRLVEQIGSGISRMRDLMKEEGLTPPEFNTDGMFTVAFRRPFDFQMWVNKWVNNLSEKQIIILKAIHENSAIKKSTLQELTDFSASAIDKNLEILKKEGLLEREGTKGGIWILHYSYPKVSE